MEIVVCVKHVVDTTEVRIDRKTNELILRGIPTKISDYDKHAIEEAVRIKGKLNATVTLLSIGPKEAVKSLKEGLAMGADKAVLISEKEIENLEPTKIAYLLSSAIKKLGNISLVLCGAVSEDGYNAQVGPAIAEGLNLPHIAYAGEIKVESNSVTVDRYLEDRIESLKCELPVLITVDRRINTPRLPTVIQVMKVSTSKIVSWNLAGLGFSRDDAVLQDAGTRMLGYRIASMDRKNIVLEGERSDSIDELINHLDNEGVV